MAWGSARARLVLTYPSKKLDSATSSWWVGYVVMPEHIHLLISEPERGTPSTLMQVAALLDPLAFTPHIEIVKAPLPAIAVMRLAKKLW